MSSEKFVFIGGGLVPLLLTDSASVPARPTKDVDVVFTVATSGQESYLRQDLLQCGFRDTADVEKPDCALFFGDWRVDFLPSSRGNRWFGAVMSEAVQHTLDDVTIWRASTPTWIAAKLEAWLDRGRMPTGAPDYYHQDLEDIVSVVDGRIELVTEISECTAPVAQFLSLNLGLLLSNSSFLNVLPGHVGGDQRANIVIERIDAILARISPFA